MENIILVEYFTSKSKLKIEFEKNLISEALKICDSISLNFTSTRKLSKLTVIRNKQLRTIESEKIEYLFTDNKVSMIDILKRVKKSSRVILIAPEIRNKSLNMHSKLRKRFKIIGSDLKCIEIFSSKVRTFEELNELKLPIVKSHIGSFNFDDLFLTKPEYGAGSFNVVLTNNLKKKKKNCF